MERKPIYLFLITSLFSTWVILLYWPGLYGPFFLDDSQTILPTQMATFSWKNLTAVSLQNQTGPMGRPLSVFTLALNGVIWGPDPFAFKAVNLGIHLLCGGLVGIFVFLLVSALPLKRALARPTAIVVATLWLVHPLHVSTVLYAVQRMTQLSAFFTLLGLIAYLQGRLKQLAHQPYWKIYIAGSIFIFFPLAALSKETGLLFPFYLFGIEYFILHFHCHHKKNQYYLIHFYRIFCLICILMALFYFYSRLSYYFNVYHENNLTLITRLLTESKVLIFYLRLILFPTLSQMGLYHDDFSVSDHFDLNVILSCLLLFAMVICSIFYRHRAPIIAFGIYWFLVSHLIESTFIPLELVFEHRNYLASIGILLLPGYYLARFSSAYLLLALLCLLLSLLTFIRSVGWSSTKNFQEETVRYHPRSPRAHIEMANWFIQQKKYSLARTELDHALQLQPHNTGILLHRLLVQCYSKITPSTTFQETAAAIKKYCITSYTVVALNQILSAIIQHHCPTLSLNQLNILIQNALDNPDLHYKPQHTAVLYQLAANVALLEGNFREGQHKLMLSYHAFPHDLYPLVEKAILEWQSGLYQEALHTREIIRQHDHFHNVPQEKLYQLDQLIGSRSSS